MARGCYLGPNGRELQSKHYHDLQSSIPHHCCDSVDDCYDVGRKKCTGQDVGTVKGRIVSGVQVDRAPKDQNKKDGMSNVMVILGSPIIASLTLKELEKLPPVKVVLRDTRFEPKLVFVQAGRTLEIVNGARLRRVISSDVFGDERLRALDPGQTVVSQLPLHKEGIHMAHDILSDTIISLRIVTRDHYVVVSDSNGRFQIGNLPVGKHRLRFTHSQFDLRPKPIRFELHKDETLDLGDINVAPVIP